MLWFTPGLSCRLTSCLPCKYSNSEGPLKLPLVLRADAMRVMGMEVSAAVTVSSTLLSARKASPRGSLYSY